MSARAENILWLIVIAAILLLNCLPAHSESKPMTYRAQGSFEVKLTPAQVKEEQGDGWPLGRMIIDKTFSGDLARGAPSLSVTVVPDSGKGQLAGLEGRMKIAIEGGKHSYEFDYTLAAAK